MEEPRDIVLNAFQPGLAIEVPSKFAGRKDIVANLTDGLRTEGVCPIIYGEKGLGKTSLANQLERIALGDVELLTAYGFDDRILPEGKRFVTFYLQCTDGIANTEELLQRVINLSQGSVSLANVAAMRKTGSTVEHAVKLKFFETKLREEYKTENRLHDYFKLSVEERLQACIEYILEEHDRSVLLIIDELDRVQDTLGLASFIKSNSSRSLKFVLVGIAHNYSSLLADHASLERVLLPCEVGRMRANEVSKVVDLIEEFLANHGIDVTFTREAKKKLVRSAAGFPWFVHAIGREALRTAYDGGKNLIDSDSVDAAIAALTRGALARQFEDLYLRAVGNSENREIVLRLFAKWGANDIPTSEIYPVAKVLGVTNPSVFTGHLNQVRYGAVLGNAPFEKTLYSFNNAMFHQYIRLRPSVYKGVGKRVDQEWKRQRGDDA